MNFYSFHIGDYLSATRHLTWEEDAAYRRLLDIYYTREAPLPPEPHKVCRLVVAATKRQREAVSVVLHEFFELTEQGWINSRADAEIRIMRAKKGDQDTKEGNESDRMKRHRERRAELFALLRDRGIVPAYDIGMKELQRLADDHCNAPATPETSPATAPVTPETPAVTPPATPETSPATAIFTNTNTNTNTKEDTRTAGVDEQPPGEPDGSARAPSAATAICMAMKAAGIGSTNPSHPDLKVLIDNGADIGLFVEAAKAAVKKQKGFAYAMGIVGGQMRDAAEMAQSALAAPQSGSKPGKHADFDKLNYHEGIAADGSLA